MTLRIGIDGRSLENNITGVGRYVWELCQELEKTIPDAKFFVYSQWPLSLKPISERWSHIHDTSNMRKYMKSIVWQKLRAGKLCKKDNLDVYWAGSTFTPRLNGKTRIVVTVHDLNHLIAPKTMPFATYWAHKLFFRHDVLSASAVSTNSYGTAKRLFDAIGRKVDAVVTPAVSELFYSQGKDTDSNMNETLRVLKITKPYILALGTWEPRKNLALLIQTFTSMKADGLLSEMQLVLAGGRGWKDENLAKLIDTQTADDLLPLGYVNDSDLPALYKNAECFVFPSFYEGYGIPVLEARASNTIVVTTDIPELREAGGKNSIYIQPTEIGIKNGILASLKIRDPNLTLASGSEEFPKWSTEAKKLALLLC
ncbi:glycosyltransferase family 1 protein [Janthinobacterium rivuli]|uniref:Glycosyltransferase family 1 protein n=1 Tax=Janthinobacterium rivuli TaxID=2751478 RepID=A0ABY8I4J6_9BURK|nr:glycosyltransferase family 1 protein [Janthinobacterium rivuli]WFR79434.1 glycosyltransferase family 1 protein [Janthinobacterium rivuli]